MIYSEILPLITYSIIFLAIPLFLEWIGIYKKNAFFTFTGFTFGFFFSAYFMGSPRLLVRYVGYTSMIFHSGVILLMYKNRSRFEKNDT